MPFTPSPAQLAYLGTTTGFYADLQSETITKICAALDLLFEEPTFFAAEVDPIGPPTIDDVKYRLLHTIMSGQPYGATLADQWRSATSPRNFS